MNKTITNEDLSMLQPGESGVVTEVAKGVLAPKLIEMGLFRGRILKVLFQAPFNGPIAVEVGGYVLSLRKEEARTVSILKV